jgi:hypothetical protein
MDGGHLNFAEEDILLIRNGLDSSSQPVTAARRSGV